MNRWLVGSLLVIVTACATSPLGRKQLKLFPDDQMQQMGVTAYQEIKQQTPQSDDPATQRYVECISNAVVTQLEKSDVQRWEVTVFRQEEPNAFALPGGKIGVHTGIMKVAHNQDQLATVIGHEVAHVVAGHSNERLSTTYATQAGLEVLAALTGGASPQKQQIYALLGVGAQVGILLPFSRKHESEADLLGLDLMAKAGFDPRQSVSLWQNMEKIGGGRPPEFLSTHPSGETRIRDLEARIPQAMQLYQQAQAQGRQPHCAAI